MTPSLLKQIAALVTDDFSVVCYTALLIGFYLFLRKSNLVPDSKRFFDPRKQLTRASLAHTNGIFLVTIHWTKTLQTGDRDLKLPLLPNQDLALCPAHWLSKVLALSPGVPSDPLFALPDKKGKLQPITYAQLSRFLRTSTATLGYKQSKFTLHSLRRGGTTWAFKAQVLDQVIQLMGDWVSDAFRRYIDLTLEARTQAALQMVHAMAH